MIMHNPMKRTVIFFRPVLWPFIVAMLLCLTAILPALHGSADPSIRVVCMPPPSHRADEQIGPIVINNMPIAQVLALLQRTSGRLILTGSGLPDVKLNFNSGGRITRIDAIFALENLLAMNGINLVRVDETFVRAVRTRESSREGPTLLTELPTEGSSQFYAKVFPLKYLASSEAQRIVGPLVSGGRQSTVVNMVRSNSLLVVDTLTNLQFIERILSDADEPGESRNEVYFIPVSNGPVRDVFRQLTSLRRTSHSDVLRGTTFLQDDRTNQIIVSTSPAHLEMIRKIISDLDQDVAPLTTSRVFAVRYGNLWTINSILNGIINHQRRNWSRQRFALPGVRRDSLASEDDETLVDGDEGPQMASSLPDEAADPEAVMMEGGVPELQFSPYLAIFVDRQANNIIAYGTPSDLDRLAKLITDLDVETAPLTESRMVYVKHSDANHIGNMINRQINTQRWLFAREGLRAPDRRLSDEIEEMSEGLQFSPFASVATDRRTNALLIYGTRNDLNQIQRMVEQLDVETAPVTDSQSFALRHSEANATAQLVNRIIQMQRVTFQREGIQSPDRRFPGVADSETGEMMMPGENEGLRFSPFVSVVADRRSNSVIVYGTRDDIRRIGKLIEEMDVEAAPLTRSRVFFLEHSQAASISSIVTRLINVQRTAFSREGLRAGQRRADTDEESIVQTADLSSEFSPFASVIADQRANALLAYGTPDDLERIAQIVQEMDISVDPLTSSEVFKLTYAQSNVLVNILNQIIRGQQRAIQRVASVSRHIRVPGTDDTIRVSEGQDPLQFSPYVTLVADRRSNSIIAYGTPDDLAQISQLVSQTDTEVAPYTRSEVISIRHGEATNVVRTLNTLISSQQRIHEREATLRRMYQRDDNGRLRDDMPFPEIDLEQPITTPDEFIETVREQFIDPSRQEEMGLQFSPFVSIVADDRSNSVVAYGTEFDLQQINHLIEKIDIVLPQVRIEVVIAEVLLADNQVSGLSSFGINYRMPFDPQNPGIGDIGIQTEAPAFDGGSDPAFSSSLTLSAFSLQSIFNVAQKDRSVKVLSAPTIVTTHNRLATINVGEARPIVTSTTSTLASADLATRSTIEFRDIGIELRVRPLIGPGSHIQMQIEQVVDTVIGTQQIERITQPIISTRRASSFISVRDQEVIVLGGLQSVDYINQDEKVWLLGDLPVLGGLFRPNIGKQEVRELIIFIKPYIVESTDAAKILGQEEMDRSAVGDDIQYFMEEGRFREHDLMLRPRFERLEEGMGIEDADAAPDADETRSPEPGERRHPPRAQTFPGINPGLVQGPLPETETSDPLDSGSQRRGPRR